MGCLTPLNKAVDSVPSGIKERLNSRPEKALRTEKREKVITNLKELELFF